MIKRPSRILSKTEDYSSQTRYWEFFIKNTDNLISVIGKLGLFYGVLEILIYIWKINFMPSGLSLSDGIIFIFTALTSGLTAITSAITFGFIFCSLYDRIPFSRNKKITVILLLVIIITIILYRNNLQLELVLFFLGVFAFLIYMFSDSFRKKRIFLLPCFILLSLYPDIGTKGGLALYTMKALGIRHENTAIDLSNSNMEQVKAIADTYGFSIDICTFKMKDKDRHILLGSTVLWNGIGSKSLIEIRPKQPVGTEEYKEMKFSIELDAAGVWPIRGENLPAVIYDKNVNPDEKPECGNPQPKPKSN